LTPPVDKELPIIPSGQDIAVSLVPSQDTAEDSRSSTPNGLDILVTPQKLVHTREKYLIPKKKSSSPVKHPKAYSLRPRKCIPGSLTNNGTPTIEPRRTKSAPVGPLRDNNGAYNGTPKTPHGPVKMVPPPLLRKSRSEGDLFTPHRETENDYLLLSNTFEDPTESFLTPESQSGPMEPIYLPPPPVLQRMINPPDDEEWDVAPDDLDEDFVSFHLSD
jgi:hypothetical protein